MPATSKGPKEQLTFSIQKPNSKKFSRVHPSEEYSQMNVPVLIDPDDNGKYYFVMPGVEETLPDFVAEGIRYIDLYAGIDHTGSKFIWPVKQSDTSWYLAATKAAKKARKHWVSIRAVKGANTYEASQPINAIAEPDWESFPSWGEMIESAFHERVVLGPTDPIVVTLAGGSNDDDDDE